MTKLNKKPFFDIQYGASNMIERNQRIVYTSNFAPTKKPSLFDSPFNIDQKGTIVLGGNPTYRAKNLNTFLFIIVFLFTAGPGISIAAQNDALHTASAPAEQIKPKASPADANAPAKTKKLRASYYACLNASDGVTAKVVDCTEDEFSYQDARLNRVYRQLRSVLPTAEKVRLRDEERQWIAEGDTLCKGTSDGGGTADLLNARSCALNRTADRADSLESMAQSKHTP